MGYFILLDLDGTLLTDDKRIQKEEQEEALRLLKSMEDQTC